MLEAQLNHWVEAHKCGLGTLARGTLVTIESGPNITNVINITNVTLVLD